MIYFVHGDALNLRVSFFSLTRVFVNYNVITYVLDGSGYNHFFGLVSNETFEIHLTRRPRLFIVSLWNWNCFFRFSNRRVNFVKPKSDFILWNFKFATTLKILLCGTWFNIRISIWKRQVCLCLEAHMTDFWKSSVKLQRYNHIRDVEMYEMLLMYCLGQGGAVFQRHFVTRLVWKSGCLCLVVSVQRSNPRASCISLTLTFLNKKLGLFLGHKMNIRSILAWMSGA